MGLEQVTERLRKVQQFAFESEESFAEAAKEAYGENVSIEKIQNDTREAVVNWLAERDPTPLTQNIIVAMGGKKGFSGWYFLDGKDFLSRSLVLTECEFEDWQYYRLRVKTVGELRTLARLAGVELKENKLGPWKDASEVPLELVAALKGGA